MQVYAAHADGVHQHDEQQHRTAEGQVGYRHHLRQVVQERPA
jgi:hypothetical protein